MLRLSTCASGIATLALAGVLLANSSDDPASGANPESGADPETSSATSAACFNPTTLPAGLKCSMGYTRRDVPLQWYDATDGAKHGGVDPETGAVMFRDGDIDDFVLPFPFIYFGKRYTSVGICENGWISFTECEADQSAAAGAPGTHLPNGALPSGVIAPFWKDLDPSGDSRGGVFNYLYLKTFGTAPNRAFVATWDDFPEYGLSGAATHYTFQIVLYETTNVIRFQYLTMDGPTDDAVVGIENEEGTLPPNGEYAYKNKNLRINNKAMEWDPVIGPALPDKPLNCASANVTAITDCKVTPTLQNYSLGAVNNLSHYGCSANDYLAFEKVFQIDIDRVTLVDFTVFPQAPSQFNQLFLMSSCNQCQCLDGGTYHIHTVLGPGRYYLVVDGPVGMNGPINLQYSCEPLLANATGATKMTVADCGFDVDYKHFYNLYARDLISDNGFPHVDGWFRRFEWAKRSYFAVRVDGDPRLTYTTAPDDATECSGFTKQELWIDDNTDTAMVYWQAPEVEVIQTVLGTKTTSGTGSCCGLRIDTRVRNIDMFPHYYEFRALYHEDFGTSPGPPNLCLAGEDVGGGPLKVGAATYTTEQTLSCDPFTTPPGVCAMNCADAAEVQSADDVMTKLVIQMDPRLPATPDAVRGEWVQWDDVNRICGGSPNPWLGAVSSVPPNSTADCADEDALVYAWRVPPGTQTSCATCTDCPSCTQCLLPSDRFSCGEYTFTHFLGRGCRLNNSCTTCFATAAPAALPPSLCLNEAAYILDSGPQIPGCPGVTKCHWTKDGVPFKDQDWNQGCDVFPANEVGVHTYSLTKFCDNPPNGLPCSDTRDVSVTFYDCAACAIGPVITGPTDPPCINAPALLESFNTAVNNCPGTVNYHWFREGVELVAETGTTLTVTEPTQGTYNYRLTVTCDAPPTGLNCSGTSADYPLVVIQGSGSSSPADVGNKLTATREAINNVHLRWIAPLDGTTQFDVLRGLIKTDISDPLLAPPVLQGQVTAVEWIDVGAVPPLPSPEYLYRVRGLGCGGAPGPY